MIDDNRDEGNSNRDVFIEIEQHDDSLMPDIKAIADFTDKAQWLRAQDVSIKIAIPIHDDPDRAANNNWHLKTWIS